MDDKFLEMLTLHFFRSVAERYALLVKIGVGVDVLSAIELNGEPRYIAIRAIMAMSDAALDWKIIYQTLLMEELPAGIPEPVWFGEIKKRRKNG